MFKNYSYDSITEKHTFEINNVDLSVINGIRRTILTDIPIIGFIGEEHSTIDIKNNNGPLHNEFMSHRLGLIPLNISETELENYNDNDLVFELNEINNTKNTINITTNMIKGKRKGVDLTKKELDKIFPMNETTKSHILITRLRTEEHFSAIMSAVKRTARFNASFSPVSLCNLSYIQDPKLSSKETDILNKERLYYKDEYGEPNKIKFDIESINGLSHKYLFNKAIEIIVDKLNSLREKLLNNNIKIEKFQELENTIEFFIDNEDDTLGNIIQSIIHNNYIRKNVKYANSIKCNYIGYICPHPLKYLLVIRITLEEQKNKEVFINFLESNCKTIIDYLNNVKLEFNKFK